MLSQSSENTMESSRKDLGRIVEFFKSRDCYMQELTWCAEKLRNLEVRTLLDADAFMVQDDIPVGILPEDLQHDSLGFCRGMWLIYSGRLVYPVKDIKGNVMGFCGYDKFSETKYLDSQNFGYKAKYTTIYGMERLANAYKSNEPVFFTEGIVCTLFLRQEGFQSFACLGSHLTPYVIEIIKRFGKRAFVITDSDQAGNKFRTQVRYACPQARPLQSRIEKDIDDSRKVDPSIVDELRKLHNPFYISPLLK